MINANFCGLVAVVKDGDQVSYRPLSVRRVNVKAEVRGWAAGTTATVTYENLGQDAELQFVFPLVDNIGITKFEGTVDGAQVVAKCKQLEAVAKTDPDNSSTISADVYRIPVGKVAAGKTVVVTLGLVQQLRRVPENGLLVLDSAGVFIPRHLPRSEITDANSVRDKLRLRVNHVAVTDTEYDFKFKCNAVLGSNAKIGAVRFVKLADTSRVKTEFSSDKTFAKIKFTRERFRASDDLQVGIEPADINLPVVYVERGTTAPTSDYWLNKTVAGCWFEPGTKTIVGAAGDQDEAKSDEYWLILDRSGSMYGPKNEEAKKMLLLFVKSLPVGCQFNIIGFGSTYETLFPHRCVDYTEATAEVAVKYATTLKANLGGTSVMGPLNFIYSQEKPKHRRYIILLTDGQFGESFDAVKRIVASNAATSSLFTIGIGKDVNMQTLVELARTGSGMSEFIEGVADFQTKVIKIMKAVSNQSVTGTKLEWTVSGGVVDKRVPSHLASAFYYGSPMWQCVDVKRTALFDVPLIGKVTLTATGGIEHSIDFTVVPEGAVATAQRPKASVELNFEDSADDLIMHQFVAFRQLLEMLETPSRINEAVRLSEASGILCKYTSFVLHSEPNSSEPLTDEKGNVLMSSNSVNAGFTGPAVKAEIRTGQADDKSVQLAAEVVASASSFEAVTGLQQVSGGWKLNEPLVKVVGEAHLSSVDALRHRVILSVAGRVLKPIDNDDDAIATLVGLAVLRRRFLYCHGQWEIIEQKAHAFLQSKSNDVSDELLDLLALRLAAAEEPKDDPTTLPVDDATIKHHEEQLAGSSTEKPGTEPVEQYSKRVEIFGSVDKHALQVSRANQDKFQDVVTLLIHSPHVTNDLEKARSLFIWLASKNLATMQFTNVTPGSPEDILMGLKAGRETYAAVYEMLCARAGLTCVTITGFAKGIGYRPSTKFVGEEFRGSWNAVKIDGLWRLANCNWAARRLVVDDIQYKLDEFFFLTNPKHLIYTHYPTDARWQLIDQPISLTEFEYLPPAKSLFFTSGLSFVGKSGQAIVLAHDGEVTLELQFDQPEVAAKMDFDYTLLPTELKAGEDQKEATTKFHNHVFHEISPQGLVTFHLRLPNAGDFRFIVFATNPEDSDELMPKKGAGQSYTDICEWKVIADRAADNPLPYPPCNGARWGPPHPVIAKRRGFSSMPQNARVITNKQGLAEFELVIADPTKKEMFFVGKLRSQQQGLDEKTLETPLMHRLLGKERAVFTVSAPGKGEFGLEIFTNRVDDEVDSSGDTEVADGENLPLFPLCQYLIINDQTTAGPKFPTLPSGFLGPQRSFPDGLATLSHHDPFFSVDDMTQPLQVVFAVNKTGLLLKAVASLLFVTAPGTPDEDVSEYVLHQSPKSGDRLVFVCRFPKKGTYRLEIFGLTTETDPKTSLPCIYNYLIDVHDDNELNHPVQTLPPFPKQFAEWHNGCYLTEPLDGVIDPAVLQLGGKTELSVNLAIGADVRRVLAVAGDTSKQFNATSDGGWEGTIPLDMLTKSEGARRDKLLIMANFSTNPPDSFAAVLEYKIVVAAN